MDLAQIATPALVLDRGIAAANLATMEQRARALGVRLRPHLKTAKSIDVLRLAPAGQFAGITVSTLREADYFAQHGVRDILYAVALVPERLDRVVEIERRTGAELAVVIDSCEAARGVADRAAALGATARVLIEIDCDGLRSGVQPDDPALLDIARTLQESAATRLCGVMTHAGASYRCRDAAEIRAMAEVERTAVVDAAGALAAAGMPVGWISAGSTPTATFAAHLRGVSELRAGVYMFQDLFQLGLGVCRPGDLALTVLSTVIGVNRSAGRLVLDAGALALSKDRSTAGQARDCGYGQLCELNGQPVPGLVVDELNQEHGMAHCRGDRDALARFPVGSRVRILPNHACLTAAAHEAYAVVEGGTEVIAVWPRCNGW